MCIVSAMLMADYFVVVMRLQLTCTEVIDIVIAKSDTEEGCQAVLKKAENFFIVLIVLANIVGYVSLTGYFMRSSSTFFTTYSIIVHKM